MKNQFFTPEMIKSFWDLYILLDTIRIDSVYDVWCNKNQVNQTEHTLDEMLKALAGSDLPNKPKKIYHLISDTYMQGEVAVKPIPTKITRLKDTLEDKIKALVKIPMCEREFASRRSIEGIYLDAENKCIVASDGTILAKINHDITESKLIDPKTAEKLNEKYPDYMILFKTYNAYQFTFKTREWLPIINGLVKLNRLFHDSNRNYLRVEYEGEIYFNPALIQKVLRVFEQFGQTEIRAKLTGPVQAMELHSDKMSALIMPCVYGHYAYQTVKAEVLEMA